MENTNKMLKQKIKELYIAYSERLFAYSFGVLGNYEEARDIVSETFLKALNEKRLVEDDFNSRAWLYRVATNLMNNYLTRFIRRFLSSPNYDLDRHAKKDEDVHEKMVRNENFKKLTESLRKIDKIDREMIYLKYYEDMTYAEIAKIMEKPETTISSKITRAVRRLSDELEHE